MAPMLPPASFLRGIEPLDISEDENAFSNSNTADSDTMKHQITSQEMGKIRIYVTPSQKTEAKGLWQKLNAKPLYRAIINAAKKDGLMNASAFMTHYGFSGGGKVQAAGAEMQNPNLSLCVEIIDQKDRLETFCRQHGRMLQGKVIIYKHVEHWDVAPGKLEEADASPNEPIDALNTSESASL
jgi:PII-like signaling protein